MRKNRYISLLLSLLIIISAITVFPLSTSANTPAFNKLSTYQQHFVRTMGSFARAGMYKNDILASLTVSQAILESGWGQSGFAVTGKNLFCIKAYSSWKGMVFDNKDKIVYANLDDYRIISGANFGGSGWRAYDSWIASIADHTALLRSGTYAATGIPGMFDYKQAAYAVVTAGYTNDYGYSDRLISLIENYGLLQYDNITPNQYGVIAMEMNHAEHFMGLGSTYTLTPSVISQTTVTQPMVWASTNEAVATVSQSGTVTALTKGFTLITASIGNREACVIVTVTDTDPDYNAVVFEKAQVTVNLNVRAEPNTTSSAYGKYLAGTTIKITGPAVSTGGQYDVWYPTTGTAESGATVSGWVAADFITVGNNLNIRDQAGSGGTVLGKVSPGKSIITTGGISNGWYPVTAEITTGATVSGWLNAEYITIKDTIAPLEVTKVGLNRFELNRDINTSYQLNYAVGSVYAADKTLTWTSSDSTVASVTNGLVTTHKYGTAVITATAASGVNASCLVTVTTNQIRYTAKTVATLYVREGDSAGSKSIGIINSGTEVIVTDNYRNTKGLIDDGWHYVEGIMQSGLTGIGFSKSDYIVLIAREGEESYPKDFELSGEEITLSGGYIYGADPTYTVGDLLAYVININAAVYNKNGQKLTAEESLTTGCTLRLIENGATANSADIVIMGDINGNGTIDAVDYLLIKRYILGTVTLEGAYLKAASVSGAGTVSAIDYLIIKRHFLGTYVINQKKSG